MTTMNLNRYERHYLTECNLDCMDRNGRWLTTEEMVAIIERLRNRA